MKEEIKKAEELIKHKDDYDFYSKSKIYRPYSMSREDWETIEHLIKSYKELEYKYNKALTDLVQADKKNKEQQDKIKELEEENKNLKQILEAGLNKEKQYCFYNEDGSDKCLGYSSFNDDEPCDYCKSCERLGDDK